MTTPIFQATETHTKEVEDLLPEEIQDMLSERALAEIKAANEVAFNPVEDARKLDELIELTQGKINKLMRLDIAEEMRTNLEGIAQLETEDGEMKPITLLNSTNPSLQEIMKMEDRVSAMINRYQKVLTDAMKQKRLLSGQMYGSRFSHSSQVSRMKRVRQITVTGNDLMKKLEAAAQPLTAGTEVERIEQTVEPPKNVFELFPANGTHTAIDVTPNFDPRPDMLPLEASIETTTRPIEQKPPQQPKQTDLYCSSYEDD